MLVMMLLSPRGKPPPPQISNFWDEKLFPLVTNKKCVILHKWKPRLFRTFLTTNFEIIGLDCLGSFLIWLWWSKHIFQNLFTHDYNWYGNKWDQYWYERFCTEIIGWHRAVPQRSPTKVSKIWHMDFDFW